MKSVASVAVVTLALFATTAAAQTVDATSRQQQRVDAILGALFGDPSAGGTLESQWAIGRFPLAQQRAQYEARIDADVRSGALTVSSGDRAKADYRAFVDVEARYGSDRRFTSQERTELKDRYDGLTSVVADGGYASGVSGGSSVADGQREFESRVDEAVRSRRLPRTQGTQLKTEYAALLRLETDYMRDGALSVRERDDLENRLDALDARVGDVSAAPVRPMDPAARLSAIAAALPASGLARAAEAQLRVEHEDLSRLAAAYRRYNPSADDQAYLERRLSDLEMRARVRR